MSLSKDLIFLILQFCDEENLKRTAHMLEQETGYFFDLKYFEEMVLDGNWDEVEKYLGSFTVVEDNKYSTKIYFEIRKQKFLEALDRHESSAALDILLKDLKVFAQSNKELYKEMAQLLALDDFRENDSLASYGDTLSARKRILKELRAVIEANPLLQGIIRFPQINKSRLRRLINQSLNWQHIHCAHPHPQPHIDTLFTDHNCPGSDDTMQDQLNKDTSLPPLSSDSPSSQSSITKSVSPATSLNFGNLYEQALGDGMNCHDASSNIESTEPKDEVEFHSQASKSEIPTEFPKTVERIINIGSSPTTMDFHPVHETLLLVGKSSGEIEIWDIASAEKLFVREFMVKEATFISKDGVSVNRVAWSPDGSLFGAAYSERMIHLYAKNGNYFEKQWEIDAHIGSVNDVAFSKPYDKFVVISCGDDKLIQVWDAVTGAKQYTFEGHGAPVYSVCPNMKGNVHFLFSISITGEIKAWLFDNLGSRITEDAPGFCCMRMSYSGDGKRLFSCGTNKNGESYIVEWNDSEGCVIRSYHGLSRHTGGIVQFDTWMSQFLAAGDEHLIKIWNMESDEIVGAVDADGGLPARPHVRLSRNGSLLGVCGDDNEIKILANDEGRRRLLQISSSGVAESFSKLCVDSKRDKGGSGGAVEEADAMGNSKDSIVEVCGCQSMLLSCEVKTSLIRRLVYTHAGNGILALAEDGTHLLWKWLNSSTSSSQEGTSDSCGPQFWQPKSGLLMMNDVGTAAPPCFSLSNNDSYLVSASGGMVNLYNILVFKKMRSVMPPPPAATCLLFYPPDNNKIAIGMDDSTILIYNIRFHHFISKLQGHSKRITGLAFSTTLNLLVSSGADTQIIVWDSVSWEKKKTTVLQISAGWSTSELSETHVELHKDQTHFLAVHHTQLAIYETTTLRRLKQWTIANFCTRISHATYSCDSQLVYAAMRDGIVLILAASDLSPRFEIDPSAYLPPPLTCSGCYVDPVVVAAHPQKPFEFALGLSNGRVVVVEPDSDSPAKWAINNASSLIHS